MSETKTDSTTSSLLQNNPIGSNTIERRLAIQYSIARVIAESNSISKAATQILEMICELAGWEFGAFWKVEPEFHTLTNEGVWHADDAGLSEFADAIQYSVLNEHESSLPASVLQEDRPSWIPSLDNYTSVDAAAAKKAGLNSAFILPVRSNGKLIAVMEYLTNRVLSQDQYLIDMLNAVNNQIGIFLERKVLEDTLAIQASQQHLLAQTELALSASIDYEKRLMNVMDVVVPDLADWAAIDVIDQNNVVRRVAAAHVDPSKQQLVFALQPTRSVDPNLEDRPQLQILLTGQSLLYTDLPFSLLEKSILDPEQLAIVRQLDPRSSIVVPLIAHDRILGVCTFVQSDSKRRYLTKDLSLAEDFGRRVALGLDNALLYAESQKSNADLERQVDNRTAQLKIAINKLTDQITERQHAEDQVRILNQELERRIAERTSELEITNYELHKEVLAHQTASQTLRTLLKRTRELYRISQSIISVREPNEVLSVLLSSRYLKEASRSSIAILDKPWPKDGPAPERCFIMAEWNKGTDRPRSINHQFTLKEYGIVLPAPYGKPIVIPDIQSKKKLPEYVRKRFADLGTIGLIILPLIASGEWYGLLSLHFSTRLMPNLDDLRHVRGLVDETAIAIKNMRLLEDESRARHEAEVANDLKLKFLAMISHELRTPLASIKGFTTTLLADDVVWPPDRQRDFLETINTESDKLTDLIEQLLDLSRIEAGILRIMPKKQSLVEIITSTVAQLRSIIREHELAVDIAPDLPPIFGDAQRIAQILTNLVGNAAKYSPAKTRISISVYQINNMIEVDVVDQGIGIPSKERKRVFEAFHQLENGSGIRMRGAGLGLAICKGLIEAQSGSIWIQDRTGSGTVVSFTLPVAAEFEKIETNQDN